ncbi:helix-turn-helix domain-containing protein [Paraburkholderia susongensis]|uniref:helix-turn-helix domain-containing protein n=1 Tax=Paraburkholderia susongensis TaxID=1515439 RepID=UPI000A1C8D6F|nr:helix-turn-helix transcriptional regulator [Paraburkholderia susongensis]
MSDPVNTDPNRNDRNSIAITQEKVSQGVKDFLYAPRMEIDKWVVAARRALGWSQDQLAEAVSKTRANVSHWETGKHEPNIETIKIIARLSGLDPRALFEDAENPTGELLRETPWPFTIERARFDQLPNTSKTKINRYVSNIVEAWEAERRAEPRKAG